MASISGVIPNVIGGISQQPPASRLENTAGDLKNAIPSVVSGLRKRPPTKFIADLMSAPTNSLAFFMLDRPNKEPKFVIVADQDVQVFDIDGNEEPVTKAVGSYAYLPTNAQANVGFLPIADSVYIYNKNKVVQKNTLTEYRDDPEDQVTMIVENTAGDAKFRLKITDGGTLQKGLFTTDVSTPEDVTEIATEVQAAFNADGSNSLTASRSNHVLYVSGTSGIDSYEATPGSLTTIYRGYVDEFTKLPPYENDGRIVQVDPSADESGEDSYWVQYDEDKGLWVECVGYNHREELDEDTMPHLLSDNGDGTWFFGPQTWERREAGDDESNPTPSFVGYSVKDMFTSGNRMVILADQYLVASEVDNYENFYRTTCTALLDSDRLDIAALSSESRLAPLYSAIDFDNSILLFSDKTQFILDNSSGLTPSTVSILTATNYNASKNVAPVKAGNNVLFVDDQANSSWVDLREYKVDNVLGVNTSEVITKQVPEFIPTGVYSMITNDTLGFILAFSSDNPYRIYMYSYYFAENQRVQSAWCYWYMGGAQVLGGDFDGNLLYLLLQQDGKLRLVKMELQETVSGDVEGLEIMLDMRTEPSNAHGSTEGTYFTMPYDVGDSHEYMVVILEDGSDMAGTAYPLTLDESSPYGTALYLENVDLEDDTVVIGRTYEFLYEMTPIFLRDDSKVPIQDGRLQLRYLSFLYHQTSYFEVDVDIPGRDTWTKKFTGRTMGALSNLAGHVSVSNGEFRVPVSSEASKVTVTVRNSSPFNCRFSSIEWEGTWRPKTKMMR